MDDCQANIRATVDSLRAAGFIIHPDKSVLNPTQEIQYIGFILDSHNMTVRLTPPKATNIKVQFEKLLRITVTHISIRQVTEVVGKLVAALPGVQHGDLHYRLIAIDKIEALNNAAGDYGE